MRHRIATRRRSARPWRRVARCMLAVQLLLTLFMALPRAAPAATLAGQADPADALAWVMVCTPQGMQQVAVPGLLSPEPSDPVPPPGSGNNDHAGHCLLCHQPLNQALPVALVALLLLPAAPEPLLPEASQRVPVAQAQPWRPLLARPPPAFA